VELGEPSCKGWPSLPTGVREAEAFLALLRVDILDDQREQMVRSTCGLSNLFKQTLPPQHLEIIDYF
jgi:hypothetical protein